MDAVSDIIIKHRRAILILFIMMALVSSVLQLFVKKNYNMVDYLPKEVESTKALGIMNEEFSEILPNASVMMKGISIMEAMEFKARLKELEGVKDVIWLDDMIDLKQPIEMYDFDTVEDFYKEENALFSITIEKGAERDTCDDIRNLIGVDNLLAGEAPDLAAMQENTQAEVVGAMLILIPAILVILMLSTSSWIEPLLFIATIGIAILINMGSNLLLGEISFMTNSISPVLQLAVSLDYAIFLLHSFADNRKKYPKVEEAMRQAIKSSIVTVSASALTTLFGFMALMFMKFGIGADLGINLAKGIFFSFITAMVFLPALTLSCYKLCDRTAHRVFLPEFKNINQILSRLAIPIIILVVLMIIPGYLGQRRTEFTYGSAGAIENSRSGQDRYEIEKIFGKATVMVMLVPHSDIAKEHSLTQEILELPHVTSVMSYSNTVGTAIPEQFLEEDILNQFYSEQYARLIIYTNTPEEGDLAFETVERIREKAKNYYGEATFSLGQSANLYDMKKVVEKDNTFVNIIAIISIFLVLMFSLKSLSLPLILVVTIEAGIWFNLAIPYFMGNQINFIGYLVLSTVQLGATVDYAILLTDHYMKNRREMSAKQAMHSSLGETFKSILVSASTLSIAGFTLHRTSSNSASADIGLLLGRGTIFSFVMVTCFLPTMLLLFDRFIAKSTIKSK